MDMDMVWKRRQYVVSFCHKARAWRTDEQTDWHIISTARTALALCHAARSGIYVRTFLLRIQTGTLVPETWWQTTGCVEAMEACPHQSVRVNCTVALRYHWTRLIATPRDASASWAWSVTGSNSISHRATPCTQFLPSTLVDGIELFAYWHISGGSEIQTAWRCATRRRQTAPLWRKRSFLAVR